MKNVIVAQLNTQTRACTHMRARSTRWQKKTVINIAFTSRECMPPYTHRERERASFTPERFYFFYTVKLWTVWNSGATIDITNYVVTKTLARSRTSDITARIHTDTQWWRRDKKTGKSISVVAFPKCTRGFYFASLVHNFICCWCILNNTLCELYCPF